MILTFLEWLGGALISALVAYVLPLFKKQIDAQRTRAEIEKEATEQAQKTVDQIKKADTEQERKDATANAANNSF